jgi:hypothetical protein
LDGQNSQYSHYDVPAVDLRFLVHGLLLRNSPAELAEPTKSRSETTKTLAQITVITVDLNQARS